MRVPAECYQIDDQLQGMLPHLRPAQRLPLALWVYGSILAGSATQHAVLAALVVYGRWHTIRDRLREWLYDGQERHAPCHTTLQVSTCFAPLLRWLLARWQAEVLPLALDVTYRTDELAVLAISVLYGGSAIPVAWHLLPANQEGAWTPEFVRLLDTLKPAVPAHYQVLVLCDRGLRMLELWYHIQRLGWHPVMRQRGDLTFRPAGSRERIKARSLVTGPDEAWVGGGIACKNLPYRRPATLIVVSAQQADEPWILLTDLPPEQVGAWWYSLRMWIELGFRVLKSLGWDWDKTRRTDPDRAARHWLVLAVVTLLTLAYGTRIEDGHLRATHPGTFAGEPEGATPRPRLVSLFQVGSIALTRQLCRCRLWRRLVFRPDPLPSLPKGFQLTLHSTS